jgi:hypothetical protein
LIENAEQRKDFGLRGRELVERRYSLDRFVAGYVELMRQLVNGSEGELSMRFDDNQSWQT